MRHGLVIGCSFIDVNFGEPYETRSSPVLHLPLNLPRPGRMRMTRHDLKAAKFADVVLFTGGLACALTFVYLVYSYTLTGRKYFTSLVGMSLYLGFPVAVAA